MRTKQEINDELERLDEAVWQAAYKATGGELSSEWFAAWDREKARQKADRLRLMSDCAASGGHLFFRGSLCCVICEYDSRTPALTTAQNLTKG